MCEVILGSEPRIVSIRSRFLWHAASLELLLNCCVHDRAAPTKHRSMMGRPPLGAAVARQRYTFGQARDSGSEGMARPDPMIDFAELDGLSSDRIVKPRLRSPRWGDLAHRNARPGGGG